jgi:hypothetical protein
MRDDAQARLRLCDLKACPRGSPARGAHRADDQPLHEGLELFRILAQQWERVLRRKISSRDELLKRQRRGQR